MAYEIEDIMSGVMDAIEEHRLCRFSEIEGFVPYSMRTLYNRELHKMQDIKDALGKNRIKLKTTMLKYWSTSDKTGLQIAAYRLLADEDELMRLKQNGEINVNNTNANNVNNTVSTGTEALPKEDRDEQDEILEQLKARLAIRK